MIKIKKILNIIIYFIFTIIIIFSIFYLIFLIFLITPNSVSRFYHNHLSYYFTEPSVETQIIDYVEKTCPHQNKCRINLTQAMPFKWDHAYLLYLDKISLIEKLTHNSIKIEPANADDLLLVFTKNKKMIRYHLSYNYDTEHHCVDEGGSFMECYIQRKALFLNFIDDGPEYSSDIIQFTPAHSIVDIEIEESANQSGLRSTSFILNSVNKPIADCNLCK